MVIIMVRMMVVMLMMVVMMMMMLIGSGSLWGLLGASWGPLGLLISIRAVFVFGSPDVYEKAARGV